MEPFFNMGKFNLISGLPMWCNLIENLSWARLTRFLNKSWSQISAVIWELANRGAPTIFFNELLNAILNDLNIEDLKVFFEVHIFNPKSGLQYELKRNKTTSKLQSLNSLKKVYKTYYKINQVFVLYHSHRSNPRRDSDPNIYTLLQYRLHLRLSLLKRWWCKATWLTDANLPL